MLEAVSRNRPSSVQMGLKIAQELPQVLRRRQVNRCRWKGVVGRSGRFRADRTLDRFRVSEEEGKREFVIVSAEQSGSERDVTISQTNASQRKETSRDYP